MISNIKTNIYSAQLVYLATLFIVFFACQWLGPLMSVILILLVGFPHALSDPFCVQKTFLLSPLKVMIYLAGYLLLAIVSFSFWLMFSKLALLLFLIISAYHFGEDFFDEPLKRFMAGASLLIFPFYFHLDEVERIFNIITQSFFSLSQFNLAVEFVTVLLLIFLFIEGKNKLQTKSFLQNKPKDNKLWPFVFVPILFLLSKFGSPLTFFASYFCALHSQRHFKETMKSQILTLEHRKYLCSLLFATFLITFIAFLYFVEGKAFGWKELFLISNWPQTSHEFFNILPVLSEAIVQTIFILLFSFTVPHIITTEILMGKKCDS